ncbi:hypothetical protein [Paenibacillus alginolyticus]|uniref:Glycosaminoglycan attachment site n=1 Tax=Paenibacillus alginolyticus TaxID=59839 RepID=A0ABT4GK72_9BACL|nr:hypothetical protein [Paenibacillus alginolyticus]MCY9696438.1 hypothetical protein [Paenibacillus alginolyticus]MEC0145279.1 hypothetical protein [Paenibacillus alginolyticus]
MERIFCKKLDAAVSRRIIKIKLEKGDYEVNQKDLFKPIVPESSFGRSFAWLKDSSTDEPTRLMMNKVFEFFNDIDGNFIEQFQTTGFDARVFELYLFAYLAEARFNLSRNFDRPDFIVEKKGVRVAIEATTVNPTKKNEVAQEPAEETEDEIREKLRNEVPIKFGSPLFSKLKKKYWELEQCKGIPIVIAIESFHEDDSLQYTSSSLIQYLYGERHELFVDDAGKDYVEKSKITEHKNGKKVIPSSFFSQPDTENISAIIFSNSGTTGKFKRMGFYHGFMSKNMKIYRKGVCYDPDPSALRPKEFHYDLDDYDEEEWGDGLEVFHNPNAKYPLPKDYFPDAAYHFIENDEIISFLPEFFVYNSKTITIDLSDESETTPVGVMRVTKSKINTLIPNRPEFMPEKEWFIDSKTNNVGIIVFDIFDNSFNVLIYKNERNKKYEIANILTDLEDVESARTQVYENIKRV